jgi:hypothetical protein
MTSEQLEHERIMIGDRPTVELCSEERDGRRCALDKGHAGEHRTLPYNGNEPVTWGQSG